MFDPIFNLSADVYETFIAAFLVIGAWQVYALRRKAKQAQVYKQAAIQVAVVSCRAILEMTDAAMTAVTEFKQTAEEALSDAAEAEAEMDHWRREAMQAAADADDARDDARGDPISQMLFGRAVRKSNLGMLDIDGGPSVRVVRVPRGTDPVDAIMADIAASLARSPRPPGGGDCPETAKADVTTINEDAHGDDHHADEACSTQRPRFTEDFPNRSPRAG